MNEKNISLPIVKRFGGYLHKVIPILDSTGKIIQYVVKPFMVELRPRDIMQIIVGSAILAIPVAVTEEVWQLSIKLPFQNVIVLFIISILFISLYVYFNFYRFHLKEFLFPFIKRVFAIYILSLFIVAILLITIDQCPILTNFEIAIKRIIIVAFPSSMSATVSDSMK